MTHNGLLMFDHDAEVISPATLAETYGLGLVEEWEQEPIQSQRVFENVLESHSQKQGLEAEASRVALELIERTKNHQRRVKAAMAAVVAEAKRMAVA